MLDSAPSRRLVHTTRTQDPHSTDLALSKELSGCRCIAILSLDESLPRKAREAALRDNTSVNALVREYLSRYQEARSRQLMTLEGFDAVVDHSNGTHPAPWNRESLHQRNLG